MGEVIGVSQERLHALVVLERLRILIRLQQLVNLLLGGLVLVGLVSLHVWIIIVGSWAVLGHCFSCYHIICNVFLLFFLMLFL